MSNLIISMIIPCIMGVIAILVIYKHIRDGKKLKKFLHSHAAHQAKRHSEYKTKPTQLPKPNAGERVTNYNKEEEKQDG